MVSAQEETHGVCLICRCSSNHLATVIFCNPTFGVCQELSSVLLNESGCSIAREFQGVGGRVHQRLKIAINDVLNL